MILNTLMVQNNPILMIFEIDPDIRKAKTLVSDFYTDDRYFELSK